MKIKSLYYETHVTFLPDFERLPQIQAIAKQYGFHMGKLLLLKKEDQESHKDMFFTDRKPSFTEAEFNMRRFIAAAKKAGFEPIRYKIEDCVLDSKIEDTLKVIHA